MNRSEIHNKISYYTLLLLSAALPTYHSITNLAIFLLIANWLFEGRFRQKLELIKQRPLIWLFVFFFLFHVVSMLYTTEQKEGWSIIEKKLLLLAFPAILGTSSWELDINKMRNILATFVLSCFAVSLVCLGIGVSKYFSEGTTDYLFHEALLEITGAQPIYYAMYICFAAVVLFWLLIAFDLKTIFSVSLVAINIFFLLFTVLLSARLALALLSLISVVGGYIYAVKLNALRIFWALGVVTVIAGVIVVIKLPFLSDRVLELVNTKLIFVPEENNATGLTLRIVKWKCSLQGIMTSPIMGLGIGDTQEYLQACYKENRFWGDVYRWNSHNQFLQTTLGLGLVGLIALVSCLWTEGKLAWTRKDYVHIGFLAIICICFLTESVLERKQGIVFFSLFSALLSFYPVNKDR